VAQTVIIGGIAATAAFRLERGHLVAVREKET
jgi:hypothetical protein